MTPTDVAPNNALVPTVPERDTPEWWLARLDDRLACRREDLDLFEDYYRGRHPLKFATAKFREAFGGLFREFADNWCEVVPEATAERLAVEGFRFGGRDASADADAWSMWQANALDVHADALHITALVCSEAAVIVGPQDDGSTAVPRITVEHPSQVIVAHAPGDTRRRLAALKRWTDEWDCHAYATVYLPDGLYRYRSTQPVRGGDEQRVTWAVRDDAAAPHFTANPLGVVPVVPFYNRPGVLGGGVSELRPVIPLQNAINKLVTDMLVASEFAAFRQRYATGLEVPTDPQGNPQHGFLSALSRVWVVEDETARFGEFAVSDLSVYVRAIEMVVQHLAAQTRTPPHYLLGQSGAFPSGESLKATETGLVAKAYRRQRGFGESWEEVMRLAFALRNGRNDARARAMDAETLWRDPESRSEGEVVDALTKMATLGVPTEALWQKWGASPQEIARWRAMAAQDALRAATASGLFGASLDPGNQGVRPDPAAALAALTVPAEGGGGAGNS